MRPLFRSAIAAFGLLLALAGALPRADAAVRKYYFQNLGADRGLAQNRVTAMVQDGKGFVWVGTPGGLHRYDGQRYVLHRNNPNDPAATLPDNYITALALDGADEKGNGGNTLWVGTQSQYLASMNLATGALQRYEPPATSDADAEPTTLAQSQAESQVMALLPHNGALWVGTVAGLHRLDPRHPQQRQWVLRLPVEQVRDMPSQTLIPGKGDDLWYACAGGLWRIGADNKPVRIGAPRVLRTVMIDHRGQLWAGGRDGLFKLSDDGLELIPVKGAPLEGLREVRAIAEDSTHRLWLADGTQGLRRYDPATGTGETIREQYGVAASLPDANVGSLMVDKGGLLWIGGQFRGVSVVDPRGTRFTYALDLEKPTGDNPAADNSVRAAIQDDTGALWLGTDTSRLLRYDLANDRFEDLSHVLTPSGEPRRVMAFARAHPSDSSPRVWVATSRGLFRLDPITRRVEEIDLRAHRHAFLRSIIVARDGTLWLGGQGIGALHYDPSNGALINYPYLEGAPTGLSHPVVHTILEDRRGRIWFGTGDGLDMLDPSSGYLRHYRRVANVPDSLPGNVVRALHQSEDGSLWVGTHSGLSRIKESGSHIGFVHPLAEELKERPVPVVFSIAESDGHNLWLGTDEGIIRFNYRTSAEPMRRYGLADGLQDLEFNGGAATTLIDGRLVFGGVRGINLFAPGQVADTAYKPPVRILEAWVDAGSGRGQIAGWEASNLHVPPAASLHLRIGALDFAPNANRRYRYRMDGFDKEWKDSGAIQDIMYTQLPPGRYVFRAQSVTEGMKWPDATHPPGDELRVGVDVRPPAWRSPLAITAALLGLLGLVLTLGWRWHTARQRERGYFTQIREREERLKLALWASGEQFWDYDLSRREIHRMRVDDQSAHTPEVGVQTHIDDDHDIHVDDLPRVTEQLRKHIRGDAALFVSEHRMRNPSGSWSWVRARGRVVERDVNGRAVRVAGTGRDITAVRSAERERRISSEVLRSMAEAVAVFDRDFVFVSINPAFTRITDYSESEIIGQTTSLLDSRQHDPEFYSDMRDELQRSGRWSGEIWQQRKDGNEFLCYLQASIVLDTTGQRGHYVAVLTDITDQKRAEQELRYLANYDTLTSLPNRTLLSERLSRAIVRARRQGHLIALLFLDLDRFKDINDSLGHAAGDRILRAAAVRLQETVGPEHTVARLGGDEFTVVLENLQTPQQAEAVAEKLLTAFEKPLDFDERHDVAISPSIGISLYPEHAQVPTDLLKHADTAMYQAKAHGRRTYMLYTEAMDVEIRKRATISAALRKVLERKELRLVFQPRLSLPEARITGVEALLRWHNPDQGNIPPMVFIPLAEESGLIMEIGEWAMGEACKRLKLWHDQGLDQLSMSVNVSALQLLRGDLPAVVAGALNESKIPPWRLELELTETVIMSNAAQTSATLQALRDLGVELAIDDFGTGYSSLAYLKRLPINTLKIDKEFIGDLTHDPDDEAITSTVITMAHSLGLNVVAEGVELEEQMEFLRHHGCDEIQGYWLARPLEADDCLAFIQNWKPPASLHALVAPVDQDTEQDATEEAQQKKYAEDDRQKIRRVPHP